MANLNTGFKEYQLVHNYMNPGEPLKDWITSDNFKNMYLEDWNELMSVVDKIEHIQLETDNCFNVTLGGGLHCVIQDAYGEVVEITASKPTKIQTMYAAVVDFIIWLDLLN